MGKIWLTSDLHLCHDKEFIYKPRGFHSVDEMNTCIFNNICQTVTNDDDLYILGDCFLNDNELGMEILKNLPGRKTIIFGNHDTPTRQELIEKNAINMYNISVAGYGYVLKYRGYIFYLSHYPTLTSNFDEHKPLKRRVVSLCGHTHTQDKFIDMDKGLIYHVELDAHQNNVVLIDDIIEDIKNYVKE